MTLQAESKLKMTLQSKPKIEDDPTGKAKIEDDPTGRVTVEDDSVARVETEDDSSTRVKIHDDSTPRVKTDHDSAITVKTEDDPAARVIFFFGQPESILRRIHVNSDSEPFCDPKKMILKESKNSTSKSQDSCLANTLTCKVVQWQCWSKFRAQENSKIAPRHLLQKWTWSKSEGKFAPTEQNLLPVANDLLFVNLYPN